MTLPTRRSRPDCCPDGEHEYEAEKTCIGTIYRCRKCWNWTRNKVRTFRAIQSEPPKTPQVLAKNATWHGWKKGDPFPRTKRSGSNGVG